MRKLMLLVSLVLVSFVAGCEALTMTPDGWLDPHRWEKKDTAKTKPEYSQAKSTVQF
ncbi:MAG: hypothetical protein ACYTEL_24440 [Planctomycetota bacterium]